MDVTRELMNEHQFILKYIDLMQRFVQHCQGNKDEHFLLAKAQSFADFIEQFADSYHHAKEEDVLFHYLQKPGVLTHCNPLPVMLSEHEQGRTLVKQLKHAIVAGDFASLCKNIQAYNDCLRQHIFKEDNVLYKMAEEGIADKDKIAINNAFSSIESELGKQGLWVKFMDQYTALESCLEERLVAG